MENRIAVLAPHPSRAGGTTRMLTLAVVGTFLVVTGNLARYRPRAPHVDRLPYTR